MDYELVNGTYQVVIAEVKRLMAEGWIPQGGICHCGDVLVPDTDMQTPLLVQAMVRVEKQGGVYCLPAFADGARQLINKIRDEQVKKEGE